MAAGVEISNLAAFRRDIAKARLATRDLTKALKAAGAPALAAAKQHAPVGQGTLARSGKISVSKTTGKIIFPPVYAPRAAFAKAFGRWGPAPRFGLPDLVATQDQVLKLLTQGIWDLLTVYGWAQGDPP